VSPRVGDDEWELSSLIETVSALADGGHPCPKHDGLEVRSVVIDPQRAPLISGHSAPIATGDWTLKQLIRIDQRASLTGRWPEGD
jgi:hypothetical protein